MFCSSTSTKHLLCLRACRSPPSFPPRVVRRCTCPTLHHRRRLSGSRRCRSPLTALPTSCLRPRLQGTRLIPLSRVAPAARRSQQAQLIPLRCRCRGSYRVPPPHPKLGVGWRQGRQRRCDPSQRPSGALYRRLADRVQVTCCSLWAFLALCVSVAAPVVQWCRRGVLDMVSPHSGASNPSCSASATGVDLDGD